MADASAVSPHGGIGGLVASVALHVWVILQAPQLERASDAVASPSATLWLESEPEAKPAPEEPAKATPPPPQVDAQTPKPTKPRAPAPRVQPAEPIATTTGAAEQPTISESAAEAGEGMQAPDTSGPPGDATPDTPIPEHERKRPLPQLSLWLDPPRLRDLVMVRPSIALLSAVPGYRDMLRGSDLDFLTSFSRLRLFLPGLSAKQLMLAAVHTGGEADVLQAAERVAVARKRAPVWRGSAQLRATSWVDGSNYDRGLAVHGAAFVIAERTRMPGLLGADAPSQQVAALSKTRPGAMLLLVLQGIAQYLPPLAACELVNLRMSISADLHLSLTAEYQTARHAAQAAACIAALGGEAAQLRVTRELLSRASSAADSDHTHLTTGATSAEITSVLDELTWSLRRVSDS